MAQRNNQVQPERVLNPQIRAAKFTAMTRENIQTLPTIAGAENASVSFNLPKARLLSKIALLIEGTVRVTHTAGTPFTPHVFAPYSLIRRVQVDINNGFSPFKISGDEAYFYNLMHFNAETLKLSTTDVNAATFMENNAAAAPGADNRFKFTIDLPISLNSRDPIGLILLQNEETNVSCLVDVGSATRLLADTTGYTVELVNISITPVVTTFTIPVDPEGMPDLSILKLVHSTIHDVAGGGLTTVKLPVGLTYRKLLLFVEDGAGGISEDRIGGNVEILFNQADIPYAVNPKVLRRMNTMAFGFVPPVGLYVFDFSDQGLTNYGGARDYIDTERLTEFWVQLPMPAPGRIRAVYETLSRLRVA